MSAVLNLYRLHEVDVNDDGQVTESELYDALLDAGLDEDSAQENVSDFFSMADPDNTGAVYLEDFIAEYKRMSNFLVVQQLTERVEIDLDEGTGDHKIDRDEFYDTLLNFMDEVTAEDMAEDLFQEMDANGNGYLTLKELESWYEDSENNLRALQEEKFGYGPHDQGGNGEEGLLDEFGNALEELGNYIEYGDFDADDWEDEYDGHFEDIVFSNDDDDFLEQMNYAAELGFLRLIIFTPHPENSPHAYSALMDEALPALIAEHFADFGLATIAISPDIPHYHALGEYCPSVLPTFILVDPNDEMNLFEFKTPSIRHLRRALEDYFYESGELPDQVEFYEMMEQEELDGLDEEKDDEDTFPFDEYEDAWEPEPILGDALVETEGRWICGICDTNNTPTYIECRHCGNERFTDEDDYECPVQELADSAGERYGPPTVNFRDMIDGVDPVVTCLRNNHPGKLFLSGNGSHSTASGDVQVTGGCWYYEVHLSNTKAMKFGWMDAMEAEYQNEQYSVGGYSSWGFGWIHNQPANGTGFYVDEGFQSIDTKVDKFKAGDVLGVGLDSDNGLVEVYLNGEHLQSYQDDTLALITVVPAVTLADGGVAAVVFNIDNFKFKCPSGYQSLEESLKHADYDEEAEMLKQLEEEARLAEQESKRRANEELRARIEEEQRKQREEIERRRKLEEKQRAAELKRLQDEMKRKLEDARKAEEDEAKRKAEQRRLQEELRRKKEALKKKKEEEKKRYEEEQRKLREEAHRKLQEAKEELRKKAEEEAKKREEEKRKADEEQANLPPEQQLRLLCAKLLPRIRKVFGQDVVMEDKKQWQRGVDIKLMEMRWPAPESGPGEEGYKLLFVKEFPEASAILFNGDKRSDVAPPVDNSYRWDFGQESAFISTLQAAFDKMESTRGVHKVLQHERKKKFELPIHFDTKSKTNGGYQNDTQNPQFSLFVFEETKIKITALLSDDNDQYIAIKICESSNFGRMSRNLSKKITETDFAPSVDKRVKISRRPEGLVVVPMLYHAGAQFDQTATLVITSNKPIVVIHSQPRPPKNYKEIECADIIHNLKTDAKYRNTPFLSENPIEAIRARCQKEGARFSDPDFPANGNSLGLDNGDTVEWARFDEISDSPALFTGRIEPNDIRQGQLGNCWLIAIMASLGNRPDLIRNLFQPAEINPEGVYTLRLFNKNESKWMYIVVDDRIPVNMNGRPIFAHHRDPNEFWGILIEKAWAKLAGKYKDLDANQPGYDFVYPSLTGGLFKEIYARDDHPGEWENQKILFKEFKTCLDANPRWCVFTGTRDDSKVYKNIVGGHAYTLLGTARFGKSRLVQLRNPWGSDEWSGDWSDKSAKWTKERKAKVPFKDANDGTFFMPLKDFQKNFNAAWLLKLPDGLTSTRKKFQWKTPFNEYAGNSDAKNNPQILCQLEGKAKPDENIVVEVGFDQSDGLQDMGLWVFALNGSEPFTDSWISEDDPRVLWHSTYLATDAVTGSFERSKLSSTTFILCCMHSCTGQKRTKPFYINMITQAKINMKQINKK